MLCHQKAYLFLLMWPYFIRELDGKISKLYAYQFRIKVDEENKQSLL